MRTIALYSIKGGVGKTAACVNLAYLSSLKSGSTILCDLDPQGASTFYYKIEPNPDYSSDEFLSGGKKIGDAICGTDFNNLDLLPADLSFRNLDIQLSEFSKSRVRLRKLLNVLKKRYDMAFLDCPPGLNLVSENIFVAADIILVPIIPTTLSLMSYKKLLDFFKEKKLDTDKLYPFFSMVESRKLMHRQVIAEMLKSKTRVMKSYIPYSAAVEKMGFYRAPITARYPDIAASEAFKNLWREVNRTIKKLP